MEGDGIPGVKPLSCQRTNNLRLHGVVNIVRSVSGMIMCLFKDIRSIKTGIEHGVAYTFLLGVGFHLLDVLGFVGLTGEHARKGDAGLMQGCH